MFDYVIVGAGAAGCVLANRLSADPGVRVCLLEAGGANDSPLLTVPAMGAVFMAGRRYDWRRRATPRADWTGPPIPAYCGRGLGGSGVINALVYCRGDAADYDAWAAGGADGWSWAEVEPAFREVEAMLAPVQPDRCVAPLAERFLAAAREAGIPANPDFDRGRVRGIGRYRCSIRAGRRVTAADAWLAPARPRDNLTVLTGARARRLLLNGQRVVGVAYDGADGVESVFAAHEVLLCAGAFHSPALLMHSGIGPPTRLRAAGIAPRHALSGVGENLQDHPDYSVVQNASGRTGFACTPTGMVEMGAAWLRYLRCRDGPFACGPAQVGGFIDSGPGLDAPDLQLHFLPMRFDGHARGPGMALRRGVTCRVSLLTPNSRGRVFVESPDVSAPPRIQYNLLADPADTERLVAGVEQVRRLFEAPVFDPVRGRNVLPGEDTRDPAAIAEAIRQRPSTLYHPVGTCRMGDDDGAVVDSVLKVRGLAGLRVVDASVMPAVPRANTHAATLMIAERATGFIRAERAAS